MGIKVKELDLMMTSDNLVVLDFWAEWCGPCKALKLTFELFAEENEEQIIRTINIDTLPELAQKYNVRSLPTILYLKNGEVLDKKVGNCTLDELNETLLKHI